MSDLQDASQEIRALFGAAAASFILEAELAPDPTHSFIATGLKVYDTAGKQLAPTFAALRAAVLPLLGEDDEGEDVLEAAAHVIPFGTEAAYLEAVADLEALDDLMGQIVYQDAIFDLTQALNNLARVQGEQEFTLPPVVDADAIRINTEEAIAAYLFDNGYVQRSEETAVDAGRGVLYLVAKRLTPQEFAALRAASGVEF